MVNNGLIMSGTMPSEPRIALSFLTDSQPAKDIHTTWNNSFSSSASFKTVSSSISILPDLMASPNVDPLGSLAQSQHLFDRELNGVSIEQKIELALELVKTHLVFTVNDEINSLKEEIYQLLLKKSQLESENTFLKLHATPETLSLLNSILEGKAKTPKFFLD